MSIKVIGIGLEGKNSLTDSLVSLINQATVLIGGDRHLSYFSNHLGIKIKINDISAVIDKIKEYQKRGEKIVILATGDPLFFGIGRILINHFTKEELEFFPHITCVQLAFNRLKISWQDATFISLHGRSIDPLISSLKNHEEKIAILTDNINNPLVIWQVYQQLKTGIKYDFWLCENLGSEQEKIILIQEEKDINLNIISPLNIVIFIKKNSPNQSIEDLPLIGIPDNLFHTFIDRPGLMTKKEVRLMVLGALALQPKQIIWDIGAGTGSVSIEIARLLSEGEIYAIEKTAIGCKIIENNCQKFNVNNIKIISNSAEKIIEQLPNPDRVFIGGSGGKLEILLEKIKTKINPQGKVVIALATLENLNEALNWCKENNWHYQILNVQISKSISIAKNTRFLPLNPVNILIASCD